MEANEINRQIELIGNQQITAPKIVHTVKDVQQLFVLWNCISQLIAGPNGSSSREQTLCLDPLTALQMKPFEVF